MGTEIRLILLAWPGRNLQEGNIFAMISCDSDMYCSGFIGRSKVSIIATAASRPIIPINLDFISQVKFFPWCWLAICCMVIVYKLSVST